MIHVLKMQSGAELEMKIAWVLALAPVYALFFGSYSQGGKFPPLTLLTHSWVVWNNRWLPSNQMPHHQHLWLCWNGLLAANCSVIICGKRLGSLSSCVWLLSWQWLAVSSGPCIRGVSVHDWPVCVIVCCERHCRHSTNREVKKGVARIKTADFPCKTHELSHQMWPRLPLFSRNHFLQKDPFCLMCKHSKVRHVTPSYKT